MRRQVVAIGLILSLVVGRVYAGACDRDCSKGTRERIEDVLEVVCGTAQEAWSIESKAEIISSKIDHITNGAELWSIESKAEVISSKIDVLLQGGSEAAELWSIESKAEVISSKIDALPKIGDELWSIESKAEIISSKIDTVVPELQPELWSVESKAEVISSKVDILVARDGGCARTPITGQFVIGAPGSYCLANDIINTVAASPVLTINASDVDIDFNGHVAKGRVEIVNGKSQITMANGVIDAQGNGNTSYCINTTECHNLILSNMTLRNATDTALNVSAEVEKLTMDNCITTSYGKYGIKLAYAEACRINDSLFYGNELSITATGFAMFDGSGFYIRGSLFQFNSVGIYIDDVHAGHIENDLLSNNNDCGLLLVDCQAVDIQNVEALKAKHGDSPDLEVRTGNAFAISGGHAISLAECNAAGYNIGFDMRNTSTQLTLFSCTARENNTGFSLSANCQGSLRECSAIRNLYLGFNDGIGKPNSSIRYFSSLAQRNGNSAAVVNNDSNYGIAGLPSNNANFPLAQIIGATGAGLGYWGNVTMD